MKNFNFSKRKSFGDKYDKLNRLEEGIFSSESGVDDLFSVAGVTYDDLGNIKTLQRKGVTTCSMTGEVEVDFIDQLSYRYDIPNSSKLTSITDEAKHQDLKDLGVSGSGAYTYDGAGRMTGDGHRGLTITYNHLDLPVTITKDGIVTTILYDATGRKWKQSTDTESRIYAGSLTFQKEGTEPLILEAANTTDGRLVYDSEHRELYTEYHHKDHLGNVRLAFTDRNLDQKVELLGDASEITQQNDFYPFGLRHEGDGFVFHHDAGGNRYRFNGIERNDELGLDLAAFRSYDPAIGRWLQVDPKAEAFTWASPYNGMLNNPISNIDPLGDTTRVYNMSGEIVRTINDSHANQDHFLTSGAMGILNGAGLDGAGSNLIGSAFRALSSFFIGANTRAGLADISALSEEEGLERGFKLSVGDGSKELIVNDITGTRSRTKSSFSFPSPTWFPPPNEKIPGHSHNTAGVVAEGIDPSNISRVHQPTSGGKSLVDYEPLLGGDRNRAHPQMIISRNGYSIYTSARNTPAGSSHPAKMQILSSRGPIVNFHGITVIK